MFPFRMLRSLFALLLFPLLTLFVCAGCYISLAWLRLPYRIARWWPKFWGRSVVWLSGVSVIIEGADRLDRGRPHIFAANHLSQYDIFAIQGFFDFDFRWLAKKELFGIPVFGSTMRQAGFIAVDRSHGRQAMKSLEEAARKIADGISVVIFPEGTRSLDGKLQPFKTGAMILAIKSGVPVVPMGITGSFEVLPKGKFLSRPGVIHIRLGEPIDTRQYRTNQKQELAQRVQDEVAALLGSGK